MSNCKRPVLWNIIAAIVVGIIATVCVLVNDFSAKLDDYYDLSTFEGLELYVWKTDADTYRCGLLSLNTIDPDPGEDDPSVLYPASVAEMKTVLASYFMPEKYTVIHPIQDPHSNYTWEIADAEEEKLRTLFGLEHTDDLNYYSCLAESRGKGLIVCVWKRNADTYRCCLCPNLNRNYNVWESPSEQYPASVDEVKAVLASSVCPDKEIMIRPIQDPHSDYTWEIDDAEEEKLRELFGLDDTRLADYYGLSAFKGLILYVWKTDADTYRCGLLSGTNIGPRPGDTLSLYPASVDEMKTILASYDISKKDIMVCPIQDPHSNYTWEIDDAEEEKLRELFGLSDDAVDTAFPNEGQCSQFIF